MGNKFLEESDLWNGPSDQTVSSHGHAKRMIDEYGRQLFRQYGLKVIRPIITNLYGPGDRFDLTRTKLVGAAIRRLCDAERDKVPTVTFYGTGKPLREIMYCRDAASCLIQLAEKYDDYSSPINVGSDQEISVFDLVYIVKDIVGYNGEIIWDTSKPDGQMRKKLSTVKMKKWINHKMTNMIEGLKNTVKYYEEVGQYLDR
jgi:GDP-L-fucose synthase